VILSEAGDCGTTVMRMLSGEMGGSHETKQLNSFAPIWVMDIVCQVGFLVCVCVHVHACVCVLLTFIE